MAQVKDIYGKERGTRVRTNGYVPARNVLDELDKQNEKSSFRFTIRQSRLYATTILKRL